MNWVERNLDYVDLFTPIAANKISGEDTQEKSVAKIFEYTLYFLNKSAKLKRISVQRFNYNHGPKYIISDGNHRTHALIIAQKLLRITGSNLNNYGDLIIESNRILIPCNIFEINNPIAFPKNQNYPIIEVNNNLLAPFIKFAIEKKQKLLYTTLLNIDFEIKEKRVPTILKSLK